MLLEVVVNPESVLEKSFNVSPDNVLGLLIGFLVIVILIMSYVIKSLYGKVEKKDEDLKSAEHKTVEVLIQVKEKIADLVNSNEGISKELEHGFSSLKEYLNIIISKRKP